MRFYKDTESVLQAQYIAQVALDANICLSSTLTFVSTNLGEEDMVEYEMIQSLSHFDFQYVTVD